MGHHPLHVPQIKEKHVFVEACDMLDLLSCMKFYYNFTTASLQIKTYSGLFSSYLLKQHGQPCTFWLFCLHVVIKSQVKILPTFHTRSILSFFRGQCFTSQLVHVASPELPTFRELSSNFQAKRQKSFSVRTSNSMTREN